MTRKKQMKPGEKVGLTLTHAERTLLLNALHGLTEEIRDVIRATPTAQPVMLMLDDLDDLEGHVTAEANQTKDKKLRQRLDAISEKIQMHLDRHDDEPEVTESPPRSASSTGSLSLWLARDPWSSRFPPSPRRARTSTA